MKKPEVLLLALIAAVVVAYAADQEARGTAQVALRYVTVDDAFRAIEQKLGHAAAGAIVLMDTKRNVIAINSAHTDASSVRAFLTTFDQRPLGARTPAGETEWLTIETRGVRVDLPAEWETIQSQTNFFIQRRARHPERRIEMNAGAFKLDLPVEHYAGVVAACLATNAAEQLDHVAKRVHSARSDIDKAMDSRAGRQIADHIADASPSRPFELIDVYYQEVDNGRQYDIRSKTTAPSRQTHYRRDFVIAGVAPHEIVHVTYLGPSEEVFRNRDIIRSIRKEKVK